jgi:hypothetical protein
MIDKLIIISYRNLIEKGWERRKGKKLYKEIDIIVIVNICVILYMIIFSYYYF